MKKQITPGNSVKFSAFVYVVAALAIVALINACNKANKAADLSQANDAVKQSTVQVAATQGQPLTRLMTVSDLHTTADGAATIVTFNENEQIFRTQDAGIIAALKDALGNNKPVQIAFDPWRASIVSVSKATIQDAAAVSAMAIAGNPNTARKIDLATMSNETLDHAADMPAINTTTTGLTNVIPDFATAQLMFNYIAHQCCAIPGPYGVTHCITFQYCEDGCYARAHLMCWIINNDYHYGTKKIFSFANSGHDELCVKGEKWGGCCVNWWYHVAPLVTIQTPTGPKAYVFDPAMFDQPVLLSTWLHGQENPACVPSGDVPNVSMINVQPTASYSPSDHTGTHFNTDPAYTNTNSTLVSYHSLLTCP